MNANASLVFDFSAAQQLRRTAAAATSRVCLTEALQRVERCHLWLEAHQVSVLGFVASTLHSPVVVVAASQRVWQLFNGSACTKGQRQQGALRYVVWEGIDRNNRVTVRWEEISACA